MANNIWVPGRQTLRGTEGLKLEVTEQVLFFQGIDHLVQGHDHKTKKSSVY